MDRTAVFNIAFEMWGILICLFAFAVIFLQKNNNRDKKNVSLCMEAACIILLVADMLSWYYQGRSGQIRADSLLHAEDKQFWRVLCQLFIYDFVYVLSSCHSQQRRD